MSRVVVHKHGLQLTGRAGHRDAMQAGAWGSNLYGVLEHGTKEVAAPLYANFPLAQVSADALAGWAAMWGIPLVMDPHVTVAYTKAPIKATAVPKMSGGMIVHPGGRTIERFGDAIVLCLECPQLQARHAEYLKAGATWDYPSYRPHITLAYASSMDYVDAENILDAYDEPITLAAESRSPILSQSDLAT